MKNKKMYKLSFAIIIIAMLVSNVGLAFADDTQPEVEDVKATEKTAQPEVQEAKSVEKSAQSEVEAIKTTEEPARPSYFEDNENTERVDFSGKDLPENWVTGGSAQAVDNGWLRLTGNDYFESGYAFNNEALETANGLAFSFDFASWGGNGADGMTFFLMDGSTSMEEFNMGGTGGSLGYSPRHKVDAGLSNAFVGIGFDEFGNFANPTEGRVGGPGRVQDSVTVRGAGDGFEGYEHVATSERFQEGIDTPKVAKRPDQDGKSYRGVTIVFTPVEQQYSLTLSLQFGAGSEPREIFSNLLLPGIVPATVKYGFTATSGSVTNYHEIRNLVVDKALIEKVIEIIEEEELISIPEIIEEKDQVNKPQTGKENSVVFSDLPVRVVQEGDSLVLVPVTGLELHELGCGSQTRLVIEDQSYATLPSLCGYQGGLWLLAQDALPSELPQDYEVLKIVELALIRDGQLVSSMGAGQSAELGFFMDGFEITDGLDIFMWNPDVAGGNGGWELLDSWLASDALAAQVSMSGIYVLAQK